MEPSAAYCAMPEQSQAIYLIGAGGIVNDAHLPAYQIAGFTVAGVYDSDINRANATAEKFGIAQVYSSIEALLANASPHAIFDVAVPAAAVISILESLPQNAAVLIQKPMGENWEQACRIAGLTKQKNMVAGVNFQLRYAPFIQAARKVVQEGRIGKVIDVEINVNVYTPWHLWKFLYGAPRVEMVYHSIHYIDLVRSFLGNPAGMMAKTTGHPAALELASVRSNIIMDYGHTIRANILTNHYHHFGSKHQQSYIKLEGTEGAIWIEMDCLKDYPHSNPGCVEYRSLKEGKTAGWNKIEISGSWFPHAFIGSMAQVMLAREGTIPAPDNSVEDCLHTMACVEAAYQSDSIGGVKPLT